MSLTCPVPIHGSFVARTSPGSSSLFGMTERISFSVVGSVPMNDGGPTQAWAIDRPLESNNWHVASSASLTIGEKELLIRALYASSVMEMSLSQKNPNEIWSSGRPELVRFDDVVVFFLFFFFSFMAKSRHRNYNVAPAVDAGCTAGWDNGCGLYFLNQCGPMDLDILTDRASS